MKTEIRKLDATKREMSVEVSGEVVKNKFEDVFKKIGQEAKVSGFRPGHAPRDILEKNFSSLAQEQVLKELIPDIYNQALKKEQLNVVDLPEIQDIKLDQNSLSFKARVEVMPEINLKNYKGLKINYQRVSVTPEEVKRHIDSLKEARKADTLDDGFARGLGYPGLAEFQKSVERQIYAQKESFQRQKIENQIIETLTKNLDFTLPESLVNKQLQDLVKQAKLDLVLKGVPREEIAEKEKALNEELKPEARRQIRVYLVLAEIAKKENIPLDEQMPAEVVRLLWREANWDISD